MDRNAAETAAFLITLILLSLCVLLFTTALEREGLRRRLPLLLWIFGIAPGIAGVLWAFVAYVARGPEPILLPAFLLLEISSAALHRAAKRADASQKRQV